MIQKQRQPCPMFAQAFQNLPARGRQSRLGQLDIPGLSQSRHLLDQRLLGLDIFGPVHPPHVHPHKRGGQRRGFQIPALLNPRLIEPI